MLTKKEKTELLLPTAKFLPDGFELIDEDILNRRPNLREILTDLPNALKRALVFRFQKIRF